MVAKLKYEVTRLSEKETVFSRVCGCGVYACDKFLLEISASSPCERLTGETSEKKEQDDKKKNEGREKERCVYTGC